MAWDSPQEDALKDMVWVLCTTAQMGLIAGLWQDPVIERPHMGTRGTQQPDLGSIRADKGLLNLLDWEIQTLDRDKGQPTSPASCPSPMTWHTVHSIWQGAGHLMAQRRR